MSHPSIAHPTYRITWTIGGQAYTKTRQGPLLAIIRNLEASESRIDAFDIVKLPPEDVEKGDPHDHL